MITVPDSQTPRNERRREIAALLLSVLLNLSLLWPLLASLFNLKLQLQHTPERQETVASSTAITIEHRAPIPVPQQHPKTTPPTPVRPQPKHTVVVHVPPVAHHELSRNVPNAPPQPPPAKKQVSLAQQLAQQEQMFSQVSQRIHEQNSQPISTATIAPQPPSTWHRGYADLSGRDQQEHVFALLTVREKFETPTLHCYYVRYDASFSEGGNEDGTIPWPVCYPKDHDAMLPLNKSHTLPVPAPPPGYVLPAGTTLTPLMQQIYDGRIQSEN